MFKIKTLFCFAVLLVACSPKAKVINTGGPTISQVRSYPEQSDKLKISVMEFENKSMYQVGDGMRSMLTSALFNTNKFIIVEREHLPDVLLEQRLGTTGVISKETAAPVGRIEGVQVLIYGTITEFTPGKSGAVTGVGGAQKSSLAIDIRIVDTKSGQVLNTTTVEGSAMDMSLDTSVLQYAGMPSLLSLKIWKNTPMENAIRLCIDKAVLYLVENL